MISRKIELLKEKQSQTRGMIEQLSTQLSDLEVAIDRIQTKNIRYKRRILNMLDGIEDKLKAVVKQAEV